LLLHKLGVVAKCSEFEAVRTPPSSVAKLLGSSWAQVLELPDKAYIGWCWWWRSHRPGLFLNFFSMAQLSAV
jgi:hypothetical protein